MLIRLFIFGNMKFARLFSASFLYTLLDEIITSSVQRCVDPVLLESTIVQIIAEKNN